MSYLMFSIGYNLRWQRLLYILGLTAFVRILRILIEGPVLPQPLWMILGYYGLSWIAVVVVDAVLRRFLKKWPN